MMHIKNILTILLNAVGLAAAIIIVMAADSMPMRILVVIAAFLWILLIVFVILEARTNKPRTLWLVQNNEWVAQDGSGRTEPMLRQNTQLFDQEDIQYKETV